MPIYYCLVAHRSTVLANYATTSGNFLTVAHQILPGIDKEASHSFIFKHGLFLFPYICEDQLIVMCITDLNYARESAFLYLNAVKRRFLSTYGLQAALAGELALDAEFSQVMASELAKTGQQQDKVSKVSKQVAEVKSVMEQNIELLIDRGDNLQRVMEQVDGLNRSASDFARGSRTLARQSYWKQKKVCIIGSLVGILVLYFVVSLGCGGLLWPSCVHSK